MIFFTFLKYYSGYSLENGFEQEKSATVLEEAWKRSDDVEHYGRGGGLEEEAHGEPCLAYYAYVFSGLKNSMLKSFCFVYKCIGKDWRRAIACRRKNE